MSEKKNPFNLREMIPETKTVSEPFVYKPSTSYTEEEKEKLLENYEEVPEDEWGNIAPGTHVRYQKKGGAFMRGGFVSSVYVSTNEKNIGNKMMKLRPSHYKGKGWTINLSNNEKMWKNKHSNSVQQAQVGGDPQIIKNLQNKVEQICVDISRISNEQKRIIALIKKLHNINI